MSAIYELWWSPKGLFRRLVPGLLGLLLIGFVPAAGAAEREVELTAQERNWLAQEHPVRVRVTNFAPHIYLDEDEPKGLSVDFLKLIGERTGINFVFVPEQRGFWAAVESMGRGEGPDLILGMERNPERAGEVLFSKDYMTAPHVIYTWEKSEFIAGLEDLHGKTLAVPEGRAAVQAGQDEEGIILKRYPSDLEALKAVSEGQADAYIGDLLVATYLIETNGFANLKVAAPGPLGDRHLCFGSRPDWPELASIINKGLETISRAERSAIQGKYMSLRYEHGVRPGEVIKWVLIVAGASLLLILLVADLNRRLRRKVKERTAEILKGKTQLQLATAATRIGLWDWEVGSEGVFFSPEWKQQLGYADDELANRHEEWESRLHPDDLSKTLEALEDYVAGRRSDFEREFRLRHRDGSYRWIYTRAEKEVDKEGKAVRLYGCHVDMTRRKKAQATLERSEERYRTLFEGSQNGIIFADSKTRKLKYANPAAARMLGYSVEELCTLGIEDIHPPENLNEVLDEFRAQMKEARRMAHGLPCLRKDGAVIYADVSGSSFTNSEGTFVIGFFIDVTERLQVQRALLESEEGFRNLMEQSPVSIQIHDLDGKLSDSNAAYARLYGLSETALVELYQHYSVLKDGQAERIGLMDCIRKPFAGEEVTFPSYRYNSSDTLEALNIESSEARECWIQTRGFPVRNDQGEVMKVVFISMDISDAKEAEEVLERQRGKLKDLASQLTITEERERQRIAGELHDEVGQNLASSRLQIASALKACADPVLARKLKELSATLLQATRDTRHLVYDLGSPSLNELGLEAAIEERLEEEIQVRHGLETRFESDGWDCLLSKDINALLFRSVRELLINVVKHADASRVTVRMQRDDGVGRVTVEDNGRGFDVGAEVFRTHPEGGFGLFSIRERMEYMGGSLEIISEKGKGCRVVLSIPCPDDNQESNKTSA